MSSDQSVCAVCADLEANGMPFGPSNCPVCPGDQSGRAIYCHCYPVLRCEPATAEAEGPDFWRPVCTALCQRCHLEIQGKVRMERRWLHEHSEWFKPYVAGYYAWTLLGEDLSRDEVEARLDELLALEERQLLLGIAA